MMKIALVSGSWPPEACGVGDYSSHLSEELIGLGLDTKKIGGIQNNAGNILSPVLKGDYDIVHIQYPTMGYGRSISPAIIPLIKKKCSIVVTLHEFSNFSKFRRPWFFTFSHMVDARIFTNYQEEESFNGIMKPRSGLSCVIPIASNIGRGHKAKIPGSVCNFGLITPNKGIEDFIELAAMSSDLENTSFSLIGATTDMYRSYANEIVRECKSRGISTYLNLSENDVSQLLSTYEFAYLPFPDGASPKRGSLLAALQNNIIVLTRHTTATTDAIKESTISVDSSSEAKNALINLLRRDDEYNRIVTRISSAPTLGWKKIAQQHLEIYENLTKNLSRK